MICKVILAFESVDGILKSNHSVEASLRPGCLGEIGRKKSASEASRTGTGEGEGATEPGDMPLMPPFYDTRFWYHALTGQIT